VLGYAGHAAAQAATGEQALEIARTSQPDLIILRSYDLIVRVGGDEFVCVMPVRRSNTPTNVSLPSKPRPRQAAIRARSRLDSPPSPTQDAASDLIERADAELPASGVS